AKLYTHGAEDSLWYRCRFHLLYHIGWSSVASCSLFPIPTPPLEKDTVSEKQGKRPPHHRTFSLLGSASEIQRDPLAFLLRTQQLGEVVRLRFLFSPAYLVSDPESIKHILQYNARNGSGQQRNDERGAKPSENSSDCMDYQHRHPSRARTSSFCPF